MNAAEAIAFVGLAFLLAKVLGPIGAGIGARIRGQKGSAPDHRLAAEVEELRARVAEVEERLDFAERLLSQSAHGDQLPGGAHR